MFSRSDWVHQMQCTEGPYQAGGEGGLLLIMSRECSDFCQCVVQPLIYARLLDAGTCHLRPRCNEQVEVWVRNAARSWNRGLEMTG